MISLENDLHDIINDFQHFWQNEKMIFPMIFVEFELYKQIVTDLHSTISNFSLFNLELTSKTKS